MERLDDERRWSLYELSSLIYSRGVSTLPHHGQDCGYRARLDTRLGRLNLKVQKLRQGSYLPGFLELRKTSEKALVTVIQEA